MEPIFRSKSESLHVGFRTFGFRSSYVLNQGPKYRTITSLNSIFKLELDPDPPYRFCEAKRAGLGWPKWAQRAVFSSPWAKLQPNILVLLLNGASLSQFQLNHNSSLMLVGYPSICWWKPCHHHSGSHHFTHIKHIIPQKSKYFACVGLGPTSWTGM